MEKKQQRLYLLDLARAFAAICVVLQHYQHFYLYQDQKFYRSEQPFFEIIGFAYNFGSQAVPFFFYFQVLFFLHFIIKKFLVVK